jgi:hypothetical protein
LQGTNARSASVGPGRGLRLRFVYRRRGPSLLVADRARINNRGQAFSGLSQRSPWSRHRSERRWRRRHGPASPSRAKTGRNQVTAPIFLLVPQVKLPKRLDLDRDAERALDGVPGLIVANWVEVRSR